MEIIAGRVKGKKYKGRPLVVGEATIEGGTIFIDNPNDRQRFNIARLEGKSGTLVFRPAKEKYD